MKTSSWFARLRAHPRDIAHSTAHSARIPVARILLIALLAVLVHGYHLGVDDSEIYIPAIKKAADPSLYPFGSEFFETHAHMSLFSNLVGNSARLIHLPINLAIFFWHIFGIFLLLIACWRLASVCFETTTARWSAVLTIAGTLSVPVAGTALMIMDPYVTARSLSTPATIFAIACYISGKPRQAVAWLLFTALIHPQMSIFCAGFLGCLLLATRFAGHEDRPLLAELTSVSGLAFLFDSTPSHGAAREALFSRTYFFVTNWTWYEWIGVFAPLGILWGFSHLRFKNTTQVFRTLSRTLVPFGLICTAAALVLSISPRFENLTRLQPMRSFHLLYVVFFVMLGGLLGEYALKKRSWRWCAFFLPLAASMWLLQCYSYPHSAHIEWPGSNGNAWTSAFVWVRNNTPKDAVFALDPNYMNAPQNDLHGFRAIAERSALADNVKDSGAVSLFPELADRWKKQVTAQSGLSDFQIVDLQNLAKKYPVTWIISGNPTLPGLICPFENDRVSVCRVDANSLLLAALTKHTAQTTPSIPAHEN